MNNRFKQNRKMKISIILGFILNLMIIQQSLSENRPNLLKRSLSCPKTCLDCLPIQKINGKIKCNMCSQGFYLSRGVCIPCMVENCFECHLSIYHCSVCSLGTFKVQSKKYRGHFDCNKCSDGCLSCHNENTCSKCDFRYFMNKDYSCSLKNIYILPITAGIFVLVFIFVIVNYFKKKVRSIYYQFKYRYDGEIDDIAGDYLDESELNDMDQSKDGLNISGYFSNFGWPGRNISSSDSKSKDDSSSGSGSKSPREMNKSKLFRAKKPLGEEIEESSIEKQMKFKKSKHKNMIKGVQIQQNKAAVEYQLTEVSSGRKEDFEEDKKISKIGFSESFN